MNIRFTEGSLSRYFKLVKKLRNTKLGLPKKELKEVVREAWVRLASRALNLLDGLF
jgi:hypothetical protein